MSEVSSIDHFDLDSGQITKMRWSPDGRYLAVPTQSGSIAIFDVETQQVVQKFERHSGWVTVVAWNLEVGFLISGSRDRSVGLWDLNSGRRMPFTMKGHKTSVHSIEVTDENAYVVTCSSDRVRAFDGSCLHSGWSEEMERRVNRLSGFTAACCSNNSSFLLALAAEGGNVLALVSLLSAEMLGKVKMERPLRSLAWSSTEEMLAVGTDQSILFFRANQEGFEARPRRFSNSTPHVHALAFSGDGALLASRDGNGLKIWDVEGGTLLAEMQEDVNLSSKRPSPGIAFHPTQPLLATLAPGETAFRILDVTKLV